LLAETYNYSPFPVSFDELYGDYLDCYGLGWWYEKASEINKAKQKAAKRK